MIGWIGVDLDGTLAVNSDWKGPNHIGAPVPAMLQRVKKWLAEGQEVRIFTARVAGSGKIDADGLVDDSSFANNQRRLIQAWCEKHIGVRLKVTATKDFEMVSFYDDRCVQVEANTGRLIV